MMLVLASSEHDSFTPSTKRRLLVNKERCSKRTKLDSMVELVCDNWALQSGTTRNTDDTTEEKQLSAVIDLLFRFVECDTHAACEMILALSQVSRRLRDVVLPFYDKYFFFSYSAKDNPGTTRGTHTIYFEAEESLNLRHMVGMTSLTISGYFNGTVEPNSLPSTLKHITFCDTFNARFVRNSLPPGLESVTFGSEFNERLVNMPDSVRRVLFPKKSQFSKPLKTDAKSLLPPNITELRLGSCFNRQLVGLPETLVTLDLSGCDAFSNSLDFLPSGLQQLHVGKSYLCPISNLPTALRTLQLDCPYGYDLCTPLHNLEVLRINAYRGDIGFLFDASGGFPALRILEWRHDYGPTRTTTIPAMPISIEMLTLTEICNTWNDRILRIDHLFPKDRLNAYVHLQCLTLGWIWWDKNKDVDSLGKNNVCLIPSCVKRLCFQDPESFSKLPWSTLPELPTGLEVLDISGISLDTNLGGEDTRLNDGLLHLILDQAFTSKIHKLPPRLRTLYAGSTRGIRCALPNELYEIGFYDVDARKRPVCEFTSTVKRVILEGNWDGPIPRSIRDKIVIIRKQTNCT